jgi:hypothetical protein
MEVEDEYEPGGPTKIHAPIITRQTHLALTTEPWPRPLVSMPWANIKDSKTWNGYKGAQWSSAPSPTKPPPPPPPPAANLVAANSIAAVANSVASSNHKHPCRPASLPKKTVVMKSDGSERPPCREAPFQIEQYLAKPKPLSAPTSASVQKEQKEQKEQTEHSLEEEDGMGADEGLQEQEDDVLGALDPEKDGQKGNSVMDALELWFPTELDETEIRKRRAHIKKRLLSDGPFEMNVRMLRQLVCEYDRLFFENRLFEALNHQKTAFNVKIGEIRMKKGWAGYCNYAGDVCTIHLHPGLAELKVGRGCEDVNGIECKDVLDCIQLVFEHEMIHMLIYVFLRLKESHGRNFKALAAGLFGHPLFTHALGTKNKESAAQRVHRAQDAEAKRKLYIPGTVIQIRPDSIEPEELREQQNQPEEVVEMAAIIVRKQETVTVMFADGRLLEKVPYLLTDMWLPPDDFDGHDDLQELEKHYMLFLDNKKNLSIGQLVEYADAQGQVKIGTVLKKKPLGALLQLSPSSTSLLPFHTVRSSICKK